MNYPSLQEQNLINLEQLRAYHTERFIRLGYHCILGREVDADGLHHYLQLFHQKLEPTEFLLTLRNSDEYKMKFSSFKESANQAALENNAGIVDELFSSATMRRVANFFKAKA
ncbi:DUF4214 domain-containing protein [Nitrosomonas communis]|uniref:DUF4214 domain-containing protein n=1 Tax=Nitrosomonas communis TaxID=44574 RepID=A0A1I4MRR0_9PROT|nr:DUF4214 domain-containing protein [Nitrosomonas communis]SFM05974.1 protein of unknown function [Nitrosomonas communis]